MPATPVVKRDADKPVLLRVGQNYLRKVMRERNTTVTALARQLGVSRKHLSNILNGSAPLFEPLVGRLCRALGIAPSFLIALTHAGAWPEPAPHGFLRGSVEILGDPTEPMEDWEMLEE